MPRTGLRRRPARVCPRSALHRRGSAGPSRGRGGRGRGHCPGPLCALRTAALGGGLAGGALPPGTQAVVRATERLRAALVPAAGASFSTVCTLCHLHPQNAAIPGRREPTHLSTPDSAGGQDSRGAGAAGGGERPPFTWGRDSHARSAPARVPVTQCGPTTTNVRPAAPAAGGSQVPEGATGPAGDPGDPRITPAAPAGTDVGRGPWEGTGQAWARAAGSGTRAGTGAWPAAGLPGRCQLPGQGPSRRAQT